MVGQCEKNKIGTLRIGQVGASTTLRLGVVEQRELVGRLGVELVLDDGDAERVEEDSEKKKGAESP